MSNPRFVFRTKDPEVVGEWNAYLQEVNKWSGKAHKLIGKWFPRQKRGLMSVSSSFGGNDQWVGVETKYDRDGYRGEKLPPGWRLDRKKGVVLPFRTRKEGKEFAKLIDENQPPEHIRRRLKGMPAFLFGGPYGISIHNPGLEMHGDYLYCVWGADPMEAEDNKVDTKVWKKVKLSVFHKAREDDKELVDA